MKPEPSPPQIPAIYGNLRTRGSEGQSPGYVLAEGARTVLKALESPWEVRSLVLTPEWFRRLEGICTTRTPAPESTHVVPKEELDRFVGFRLRQGILAEVKIPEQPPEESWLHALPNNHLVVAVENLSDAANVGSVVRSAAAFGVDSVIVDRGSASPYLRRAARVSMGAVFSVGIRIVAGVAATLARLRNDRGTTIIASYLGAGADPPAQIDWGGSRCLVVGSEDAGVTDACLDVCHRRVRIPMRHGWDSLNVAAATAVLLYEASRGSGGSGEGEGGRVP